MRPPGEIDGAVVLEWAWSGPQPFFVMPCTGSSAGIPIHGLAICRYTDSGAIYRFSCDRDWESINDSQADSVEAARTAESNQFDVRAVQWRSPDGDGQAS